MQSVGERRWRNDKGFSLIELMLVSLIILVVAGAVFELLSRMQRTAAYQAEIQAAIENSRMALEVIGNILRQAGNDPRNAGFPGIAIASPTEVRVRSDLTGMGPGTDKGDPDGDTADAHEDVTIRYNAGTRSLELIAGGSAQPVASNLSEFLLRYYDSAGVETVLGERVCKIQITLTGSSRLPDPQTRLPFGMKLSTDVHLANR